MLQVIVFDDEHFMRRALLQAEYAAESGEVPVGAVAVLDGAVIASAHNQVESLKDATAHAEILVITQAAAALKDWRLVDVDLFVTKEPCAMCAGAMVNSRIKRVVFGLSDPRSGCAGSALDVTGFAGMLHKVEVTRGVLEDECAAIIRRFFETRRLGPQNSNPP
ncbi:MAG: tRNA adenosine(34) deaminase TadA [Kiritimatiellaeota bacterium]|nr:tRNA adenosine(34) deaminase TadA [Kiritimatiellota bacterium]